MKRTGASFARGQSDQNVQTDPRFIRAVKTRFCSGFQLDLAANQTNAQTNCWYGPEGIAENSLVEDWTELKGHLWLNPPYGNLKEWAAKCADSVGSDRFIYLLVPAAIGSNWFRDYVFGKSYVYALNGRLTFVGQSNAYPKDLILAVYGMGPGFDVWSWGSDARTNEGRTESIVGA